MIETMDAPPKVTFDLPDTANRMRDYHHAFVDRQRPLLTELDRLQKLTAADTTKLNALQAAVRAIEQARGDASAITAQVAEVEAAIEERAARITYLDDLTTRIAECIKHSDMAYEGMHWLCFAESTLATFERTPQPAT